MVMTHASLDPGFPQFSITRLLHKGFRALGLCGTWYDGGTPDGYPWRKDLESDPAICQLIINLMHKQRGEAAIEQISRTLDSRQPLKHWLDDTSLATLIDDIIVNWYAFNEDNTLTLAQAHIDFVAAGLRDASKHHPLIREPAAWHTWAFPNESKTKLMAKHIKLLCDRPHVRKE